MARVLRPFALCLMLLTLLLAVPAVRADVTVPHVIGDNMVLQRNLPIQIWGWAAPDEAVAVTLNKNTVKTAADKDGKWKVTLPKMRAGGPYEMTIAGKNTLTLKNIAIGEVWVCSGQSNMQFPLGGVQNAPAELGNANHPNIRVFLVPCVQADQPAKDLNANWNVCTAQTAREVAAVGYFFATNIQKDLNVPVGIISASWGGSNIIPWTIPESIKGIPELEKAGQGGIGKMYNAMIAPVIPFGIRGILWYQGEANAAEGMLYTARSKAFIDGWRKQWGQGDFAFGLVQIAPCSRYYGADALPHLWEAQVACLQFPNTGMAVTNDIVGDLGDIHPKNKQDVGKRLALWALATVYGKKDLVYSGPMYKSMEVKGDKIVITFNHVGTGLAARGNQPLNWFTIAGEDKKFVDAKAEIKGNTIVVSSDQVKNPVAVRFAWSNVAQPNLMNKEGLPASSFRTDKW